MKYLESISQPKSAEKLVEPGDFPWLNDLKQELGLNEIFIAQLHRQFLAWQSGADDPEIKTMCLAGSDDRLALITAAIRRKLETRGFSEKHFCAALTPDKDISKYDWVVKRWVDRLGQQLRLAIKYPQETDAIGILPLGSGTDQELFITKFLVISDQRYAMVVKEPGESGQSWFVKADNQADLEGELQHHSLLEKAGASHSVKPSFLTSLNPVAKEHLLKQLPFSYTRHPNRDINTLLFFEYLDRENWVDLETRACQGEKRWPPLTRAQIHQLVTEFIIEQLNCAQAGIVLEDRLAKNMMVKVGPKGGLDWKNVDLGIIGTVDKYRGKTGQDGLLNLQKLVVRQTFGLLWYLLLADQLTPATICEFETRCLQMPNIAVDPLDAIGTLSSIEGTLNDQNRANQLKNTIFARLVNVSPSALTDDLKEIAQARAQELAELANGFNSARDFSEMSHYAPQRVLRRVIGILADSLNK